MSINFITAVLNVKEMRLSHFFAFLLTPDHFCVTFDECGNGLGLKIDTKMSFENSKVGDNSSK